jgi:hypothetical protein
MMDFQRTQQEIDDSLDSGHVGGAVLMVGSIFLGMAAFLGVFNFAALRDGDMFWPTYTTVLGLIGVFCLVGGTVVRARR